MNINAGLRAKTNLSYTSAVKTLNNMSQVMIVELAESIIFKKLVFIMT